MFVSEQDEGRCDCVVKNRLPDETEREWFKRWMCMYHWMQTDYYQHKLEPEKRSFQFTRFVHREGEKED
jgi:hypothetical protein